MQKLEPRFWMFAGLLVGASLCLSLGLYTYTMTCGLHASAADVTGNWLPSLQAIDRIRAELGQLRRAEAHMALTRTKCSTEACQRRIVRGQLALVAAEEAYAPLVTPREESLLFEAYKRERAVYLNIQEQVVSGEALPTATAERFFSESEEAYDNAVGTLSRLASFNSAEGQRVQAVSDEYFDRARTGMAVLNILFLCVAAALAVQFTRVATHRAH